MKLIPNRLRSAAYRLAVRAAGNLSPARLPAGFGGQLYAVAPGLSAYGASSASDLSRPLYVPNLLDRSVFLDQTEISPDRIQYAKASARQGNLVDIAKVNDVMVSTDPMVKGPRLQRKVGISSIKYAVKDADDSPEAAEIGDAVRGAMKAPDANFTDYLNGLVECILRGEGLLETIWTPANAEEKFRRWQTFQLVPQSRLRYNLDGRFAFASSIGQDQGLPVEELPRGKFIPVQVDPDIPSYGLRGYYPAIWSPWLDRLFGRKWKREYADRFGKPIPVAEFETTTQEDRLRQALLDFGVPGFVVPKGSSLDMKGSPGGGEQQPQRVLMLDAADEIATCLVGQSQTTQIRANAGSKASAQVQNLVRLDIILSDWALISFLTRQHLFASFVEQNFGPDSLPLTPSLEPQLDEPADLFSLAQALQILVGLGLKVPAEMLYRNGVQEPSGDADEELLEKAAPPALFGGAPGGDGPTRRTPGEGNGDGEDTPEPARTPTNVVPIKRSLEAIARRQELVESDLVELIAGKYLTKGANAARPMLGAIKGVVDEVAKRGGTLEEIRDRLVAAYGKLPISTLTDILASATLEAEMHGITEAAGS